MKVITSHYKALTDFVITIRRDLLALVFAAMALLMIKIFAMDQFPAAFQGAHELGLVVNSILTSIVSSFVFYLLVVHLKEFRERQIVTPYIKGKINRITSTCAAMLNTISRGTGVELELQTVTASDLEAVLAKVDPNAPSPAMVGWPARPMTWLEYFRNSTIRTKDNLAKAFVHMRFLDACLAAALSP
jgi:hypothetical protein